MLEVRNLQGFYGAAQALFDVSLKVGAGELLVLQGLNGAGKSTLLNILGGLDTATSGVARWRDHDLTQTSDAELTRYRREHVGFVFQFYNLIPSLTVRENVELALLNSPERSDRARLAAETLAEVAAEATDRYEGARTAVALIAPSEAAR